VLTFNSNYYNVVPEVYLLQVLKYVTWKNHVLCSRAYPLSSVSR